MMKTVNVFECRPGYILAEDLYLNNCLVLPQETVLTEVLIKKLANAGVPSLKVYLPSAAAQETPSSTTRTLPDFQQEYEDNANVLKDVLSDLAAGRKLEINRVSGVFDAVYTQIQHNYTLMDCINSMRSADVYTYTHSLNVALYAGLIGKWLRLSEQELQDIIQVGVLHDMGKAKTPQEILNKKGKLTPEEFEVMKKHSTLGFWIVKEVPGLKQDICNAVLTHHERIDGHGYPFGLKGKDIPFYAKIVAVADVYDALTSERVYKKRITPFDTFIEFQELGYDHFDPQILFVFLQNIANYYTGAKVRMNTGEVGEITSILPYNISKPIVRINDKVIDLAMEPDYHIEEML
ncbi:MAG: HD-GYP domain-containing protein [Clostridia bacterium]|jgi:putative nucleotidyltransferase with HDIG domain|nr:HD-GYP domain-containing protein [Clostridia bacterium]